MEELLRTVKLSYSKGSNAGKAIYMEDGSGGTRIAGGKCWGFINSVDEFTLDETDLDSIIETAKKYKKLIKKDKNKWLKELQKSIDSRGFEFIRETDIKTDYVIGRFYTLGYSIDKTIELLEGK